MGTKAGEKNSGPGAKDVSKSYAESGKKLATAIKNDQKKGK